MSKAAVDRIRAHFGDRVLESSHNLGDDEVVVATKDWREVARFVRDDTELAMDHFLDVTAVDYPEREPDLPRFDVVLIVRSTLRRHRVRLKTRVPDGDEVDSLVPIWPGANWGEREVFDMFGIRFSGHPDLRRILMYPEFSGYPLRKDYPIEKAQPLVPYRDVPGLGKLPPFGVEEGQPFGRISWQSRLEGGDRQVSPAIALQTGQRRMLSDTDAHGESRQEMPPTAGAQSPAPRGEE